MEPVSIEKSIWIAAPRERVWQAVSDPAQIAEWFGAVTNFTKKGDTISARIGDMEVEVARVEVMDPPRQLTTRNLQAPARTTTYTLTEENGGTRFTVTETGFEALTPGERNTQLDQNGEGWEMALQNLNAYILGMPLPRPQGF